MVTDVHFWIIRFNSAAESGKGLHVITFLPGSNTREVCYAQPYCPPGYAVLRSGTYVHPASESTSEHSCDREIGWKYLWHRPPETKL